VRGIFVTFEGVEGVGKTTQIQRLLADLTTQRYPVTVTREPGGTAISEQIRSLLLDPENTAMKSTSELLLYAASRAQHVLEKINPALEEGKIVISDRFADASLAYQGYGRGLDIDLIRNLNRIATNGIIPDITFLLDLPVDIGLKRAGKRGRGFDRLEREKTEFHQRVRQGYLEMADQEPNRIKVISAEHDEDQVYTSIKEEISTLFNGQKS
ncbi:uncharacterized protein METZ01_LOCUS259898, partial [marine metagenome]